MNLDRNTIDDIMERQGMCSTSADVRGLREAYELGVQWGAGWMAAIVGMGETLRAAFYCSCCGRLEHIDQRGRCERCGYRRRYSLEDF